MQAAEGTTVSAETVATIAGPDLRRGDPGFFQGGPAAFTQRSVWVSVVQR